MPQKPLQQLLEVAKAISKGDFSKEVNIQTGGIIAELACEINNTVRNLRSAIPNISATTNSTPELANTAQGIAELMNESTKTVLDASDQIILQCDKLKEENLSEEVGKGIKSIKELTMDIVSAQSYQDNARQKLDKMEKELESVRDSLVEAMIVMNISLKDDPKPLQDKQEQLKNVQTPDKKDQKQDLVDQLLAEFGL